MCLLSCSKTQKKQSFGLKSSRLKSGIFTDHHADVEWLQDYLIQSTSFPSFLGRTLLCFYIQQQRDRFPIMDEYGEVLPLCAVGVARVTLVVGLGVLEDEAVRPL